MTVNCLATTAIIFCSSVVITYVDEKKLKNLINNLKKQYNLLGEKILYQSKNNSNKMYIDCFKIAESIMKRFLNDCLYSLSKVQYVENEADSENQLMVVLFKI